MQVTRKVTDDQVKEMVKLSQKGKSQQEISKITGVKLHNVGYWLHKEKYGVHPKRTYAEIKQRSKVVRRPKGTTAIIPVATVSGTEKPVAFYVGTPVQIAALTKELFS